MNIVIAGGTGFIGGALTDALLARGDALTLLTRDPEAAQARWGGAAVALWDGRTDGDWAKALDGADAVVNLCGASIADGRWTPARKLVLIKSRLDPARALVAALSRAAKRPKVLVSASAVGFYGEPPEGGPATEESAQGRDFLASLCGQWEREAGAAEPLGVRVVLARFGVVLGKDGGALAKMALPFKLFAGGPLGSGRQGFPWIHRDDAVDGILFALDRPDLSGAVNFAAPGGLSNREFSAALGRALGRPSWAPVPAFVLKLALGEMSGMLLGGRIAAPKKLAAAGYKFKYETADAALAAVYRG